MAFATLDQFRADDDVQRRFALSYLQFYRKLNLRVRKINLSLRVIDPEIADSDWALLKGSVALSALSLDEAEQEAEKYAQELGYEFNFRYPRSAYLRVLCQNGVEISFMSRKASKDNVFLDRFRKEARGDFFKKKAANSSDWSTENLRMEFENWLFERNHVLPSSGYRNYGQTPWRVIQGFSKNN